MSTAKLTIDLNAMTANWQALAALSKAETAAVVKANAYGLGMERVAPALAGAGARTFFVAVTEEGAKLRKILGPGPVINVFSGHMSGDTGMIADMNLTPMINSVDQLTRHFEALPGHPFGVQLDSGMNRLGMEPAEWGTVRDLVLQQSPTLLMSHLACADELDHPMSARQLQAFAQMTAGIDVPRSLANTGGVVLGPDYHFDIARPGIGVYGGLPFIDARPVVRVDLPVIQCRSLEAGETVGYGNNFTARKQTRIATVAAGYADGIIRALAEKTVLFAEDTPCPIAGRISMDLIGVDITGLDHDPESLELLGPHQSIDTLAGNMNTISYEILTALGGRYERVYIG